MLKGKKKALAAQVLLGLMVSGNAYAADITVEGEDAGYDTYRVEGDNKVLCGSWAHVSEGKINPILGGELLLPGDQDTIDGYNIELKVDMAGNYATLIKAKHVTNNVITVGVDSPRGWNFYGTEGVATDIFAGSESSKDNTLKIGVLDYRDNIWYDDEGEEHNGGTKNQVTTVDVGGENDIVLLGGTATIYGGDGKPAGSAVAQYDKLSFKGRNLTLEDADGTEKIKTANMKGDITAARHLTAESLTAGGTITANGGLSVSGTITAKALNGGAVEAGDINVASLEAVKVTATNLNVIGLLKERASASPSMYSLARAARAASGINATNINAGRIDATDVNASGSIVAGSISATTVKANDVTLNNGTSTVGTMTTGSLNIAGNGSLNVTDINVNDINITSITPGTALTVTGNIKDQTGTTSKSLSDVFKTTVNEENTALFNTSYVSKAVGNKIVTENNGTKIREQTKSLVETQMASMALTNGSADLVASAGYTNAAQAVKEAKESGSAASAMVPYAAANYGSLRQESGSYVDVDSANFNIGFAKEVKNGNGTLLFGPMVEYGRGNYESHLDDGTVGTGTGQSFGVGMMARQTNDNGFYYEGSLRYGKSTSTYSSNNLLAGKTISYDNSANYWGAHAGVGKVVELSGDNSLDLYGKLFYTRQGASSVNVDGDTLDFSAVNSKRSRIGFRYIHGTSKVRSVYAGLAWQYEFDGAAHATANGFSTPSPSVKGSSGMLELGVLIAPKASPVSFDLGVSGWAGKQKGYSLNANMCWSF